MYHIIYEKLFIKTGYALSSNGILKFVCIHWMHMYSYAHCTHAHLNLLNDRKVITSVQIHRI